MSARKLVLRIVGVLVATVVAAALGYLLYGIGYERWVLPELVKKYPHDGQLGLEEFVECLSAAMFSAAVVFIGGTIWIIRSARKAGKEL
jgi:hypothetical protein